MRTVLPEIIPVVAIDRTSSRPLYRQLYDGYRDLIVKRRLRPGQRLPSTRALAAELQISRLPVLNAFEQLVAEGYFESRIGSGTCVARALPDELLAPARPSVARNPSARRSKRVISRRAEVLLLGEPRPPWLRGRGAFSIGEPPVDRFPLRIWSRIVARHSRLADTTLLHYSDPMGLDSLREILAEYLRSARALRCTAEQIMIVGGSQQALELSAHVLLDARSSAWLEEPGYWGAQNVLRLVGARAVPVPIDDEGLDVAAGVARCPRARAAFVTPSHQFPLGVTMSASRRLQLLDWARTNGSWIIEDDYDSEYRYGNLPIASLQGLDQDSRVIYVGTLTKTLFPALRLGYIVIPPDLIDAFVAVRRSMDVLSPTAYQAVLTDFIHEGHFARHIRRMRLVCQERRRALVEGIRNELGELQILGDQSGMYLSATLPKGLRDREVSLRAARQGLWVAPLSDCYLGKSRRQGLILGYGGREVEEIRKGVHRLRSVIEELRATP